MARPLKITVKGLAEVNAKLREMEDSVSAANMRGLMLAGAEMIKQKYLDNVRGGGHVTTRTRTLKGGGKWEHLDAAIVAQSGKSLTYAKAWAKVMHKLAPQGLWLERGHRIVGRKRKSFLKGLFGGPRDTGRRTAAFPIFADAVEKTRSAVRVMIKDGIKRFLMASDKGATPTDTGWIG
jgi:hypothetical protein